MALGGAGAKKENGPRQQAGRPSDHRFPAVSLHTSARNGRSRCAPNFRAPSGAQLRGSGTESRRLRFALALTLACGGAPACAFLAQGQLRPLAVRPDRFAPAQPGIWGAGPPPPNVARARTTARQPPAVTMASGVDLLPLQSQALVFCAAMSGVTAGGLAVAGPVLSVIKRRTDAAWFEAWAKTWPLLGAVYVLAGLAHFSSADGFRAIYPPPGTWGIWYLPGGADFHVAWSGAAEILGGIGLLLGGLADVLPEDIQQPEETHFLTSTSALGLFVLTIAVVSPNPRWSATRNLWRRSGGLAVLGLA
jgi:hypothetical protein